jgi:hypothetical protein
MVLPSTVIIIIVTVNIASNSRNAKRVICTCISTAFDRDDDYNGSDDGGLSALPVVRTGGSLPQISPPPLLPWGASLWGTCSGQRSAVRLSTPYGWGTIL